jgi:hypothetical protein
LTVLCIFPPITLMFATYDGGGLALLAVTIGGLLIWAVQSGEILPYSGALQSSWRNIPISLIIASMSAIAWFRQLTNRKSEKEREVGRFGIRRSGLGL